MIRGDNQVAQDILYQPLPGGFFLEYPLTNLTIKAETMSEFAAQLTDQFVQQYPHKEPLNIELYLEKPFLPPDYAYEYHAEAAKRYQKQSADFMGWITLTGTTFTVRGALDYMTDHSSFDWWTYDKVIIIERRSWMLPDLRFYDTPGAAQAIAAVIHHLISDEDAKADAALYLTSSKLRRVVMQQALLPPGFDPTISRLPIHLLPLGVDYILQGGDLFCGVKRFLPRGSDSFQVHLFVTGVSVCGGGTFFYAVTKNGNRWQPSYYKFYDP